MNDSSAESFNTIRLAKCPSCDYSLEGLPRSYRCPECGFRYDEDTVVLDGITRGAKGMSGKRFLIWLFIGGTATFFPNCIVLPVFHEPTGLLVLGIIAIAWSAGVIYLLFTGKRDKRGITRFIIAAGGFGAVFGVEGSGGETGDLIRWSENQIVTLERKSPRWHRMKIEEANELGQLKTQFDAVVRCDEDQALEIKRVIENRIADSSRDNT